MTYVFPGVVNPVSKTGQQLLFCPLVRAKGENSIHGETGQLILKDPSHYEIRRLPFYVSLLSFTQRFFKYLFCTYYGYGPMSY